METLCRSNPVPPAMRGVPRLLADVWPEFCAFVHLRRLVFARWLKRGVAIRLRVEDDSGLIADWVLKRHADEAGARTCHDFGSRLDRHFEHVSDILVSRPRAVIRNWVVEPYIQCRSIRWALMRFGPDPTFLEGLATRYASYLWHVHALDSDASRQRIRVAYEAITRQYIDQFIVGVPRLVWSSRACALNLLEQLGGEPTWRALRHTDFQVNNLCYTACGKAVIFDPAPQLYGLNVKDVGELVVSLDNLPLRYPFVSAARIAVFRRAFLDAYRNLSGVNYPDALWRLIAMLYAWKRFSNSRRALLKMRGLHLRDRLRHFVICHRQKRLIAKYLQS